GRRLRGLVQLQILERGPRRRRRLLRASAPRRGREPAAARRLVGPRSRAPLSSSLALFDEAGMKRLRRKSLKLTRYLEWLLDRELGGRVRVLTPADPERRGCHVAIRFVPPPADASAFVARLRAAGVVADWRKENVLRLAPVPLYNRYRDVYGAVQALKRTLDQ